MEQDHRHKKPTKRECIEEEEEVWESHEHEEKQRQYLVILHNPLQLTAVYQKVQLIFFWAVIRIKERAFLEMLHE